MRFFLIIFLLALFDHSNGQGPTQQRQGPPQQGQGPTQQGQGSNQQDPNWNLTYGIIQSQLDQEFEAYAKYTNMTQLEQYQTKKQFNEAFNNTLDVLYQISQDQKDKGANLLISIPFVISKMDESEKMKYYGDYVQFTTLDQPKQKELSAYIAYNISLLLNSSNQTTGQDNLLNALNRFDAIMKYDYQNPNTKYTESNEWEQYIKKNNETEVDMNAYLQSDDVSKKINDWLYSNTSTSQDLNQTISSTLDSFLPKDQGLTTEDKQKIQDFIYSSVQSANNTVTDEANTQSTTLSQEQEQSDDSNVSYLITLIICVIFIGLGYFLGRRNKLNQQQVEYQQIIIQQQDMDANGGDSRIEVDSREQRREDKGVTGFIQ